MEAAEVTADLSLIEIAKNFAVKITAAASEGLDKDGGLWYEYELAADHYINKRI